jgi:hypothetical protein
MRIRTAREGTRTATNAPVGVACQDPPDQGSRPRLGVVDFGPIQYHTPLYQLITPRARVELDVLFLTDNGHRSFVERRLVPDNLKTGVGKPDLSDPKLNRSYAELAAHHGCPIDPAVTETPG